jgi:uncharacterized protein YcgL (UPF0745 family)
MKSYKKGLIKKALFEGKSFGEIQYFYGVSLQEVKEIAKEVWKIKDEFEKIELYLQVKHRLECEMKQRMKTKYGFYRI